MSTATPVEKIRMVIADQMQRLGAHDVSAIQESILIRNGLFCGRKFVCDGYQVVWFFEEDEIKFYSPCGDLLKTDSAVSCVRQYEQSDGEQPRRAA